MRKLKALDHSCRGYVVLIPGLFCPGFFLEFIAKYLNNYGLKSYIFKYSANKYPIEEIANKYLKEFVQNKCRDGTRKIHFLGHSMGCIIIRKYLVDNFSANLGKIIMITPPNQGSLWCNLILKVQILKDVLGSWPKELKVGKNSYTAKLPDASQYELGVIAGNRSLNPFSCLVFKEENDGLLTVSSTKLPAAKDFITLNYDHLSIIFRKETIYQIIYFFKNGRFDHNNTKDS